jgi:hypothetical protein
MASGKWTWHQADRADSRYVSLMLSKHDHSILVAFPRPAEWLEDRLEDHQLVRAILADAVAAPWLPPQSRS